MFAIELSAWHAGVFAITKSPSWHRKERATRSKARSCVTRFRYKQRLSNTQLRRLTGAINLLERHHSAPKYAIQMAWWGQNNPKNKGGYAKKQQPARKETQQSKPMEAGWLPAYDASGPKDGGGGSTSSSSSLDPQLLVVLKQLAEANPAAADTINELLPNQDHMEIKEQQKKINVLRRLQQRIHKKEAQIKTKEQQMETFMEQVKVHVTKEKQRHKDEIDELRKDIEQARTDILKIKNGGNLETGNNAEMELEEILDPSATSKETEELKRRLMSSRTGKGAGHDHDVQHAEEVGSVHGTICPGWTSCTSTPTSTNRGRNAEPRGCPVRSNVPEPVLIPDRGNIALSLQQAEENSLAAISRRSSTRKTLPLWKQQGLVQGPQWNRLRKEIYMGYMETYSPCRAQGIPGVSPERYDFAQAPCHHEFGVVMLPHEEADARLLCTSPVAKALPKWYAPYPGQSPFERIFHDSEVCRVPEDTMHDFRYEADWYQLGTLVMTIMLFGLALCQPEGQGQFRSRTEDDDNGLRDKETKTDNHGKIGMRKRKQVIHTGKWMLLPSLCPMLLLLQLRMTTASEDDNVMNQLRQRRLVQQVQPPAPTPLDQRWIDFENTYRLPRPANGGVYDAAIARPDVIQQHQGTSLSFRIHFAAEPHQCQMAIERHWQDIRIDTSPHNLYGEYTS